METLLFFLGCIAFFGIPAAITIKLASSTEGAKSKEIKQNFLKQFN